MIDRAPKNPYFPERKLIMKTGAPPAQPSLRTTVRKVRYYYRRRPESSAGYLYIAAGIAVLAREPAAVLTYGRQAFDKFRFANSVNEFLMSGLLALYGDKLPLAKSLYYGIVGTVALLAMRASANNFDVTLQHLDEWQRLWAADLQVWSANFFAATCGTKILQDVSDPETYARFQKMFGKKQKAKQVEPKKGAKYKVNQGRAVWNFLLLNAGERVFGQWGAMSWAMLGCVMQDPFIVASGICFMLVHENMALKRVRENRLELGLKPHTRHFKSLKTVLRLQAKQRA